MQNPHEGMTEALNKLNAYFERARPEIHRVRLSEHRFTRHSEDESFCVYCGCKAGSKAASEPCKG